jgi:hypothetical protein
LGLASVQPLVDETGELALGAVVQDRLAAAPPPVLAFGFGFGFVAEARAGATTRQAAITELELLCR